MEHGTGSQGKRNEQNVVQIQPVYNTRARFYFYMPIQFT